MTIIYEDAHCLIINKPPNVLVHHSHYARNIEEDSLIELLKLNEIVAYPVHRLDRKTSGLILFSKSKENVSLFQTLFEKCEIEKRYLALVRGHIDECGIINSPVKNDRGNYKEAETHYSCIKHIELQIPVEPYDTARYSIVEFIPKTGRMHQLRIHANKISHPIIGDPKYGNRHHNHMFIDEFGIDNLFLHAASLQFIHPFTKEKLSFNVPAPNFWNRFFDKQQFKNV